jgi:hypothetical protein
MNKKSSGQFNERRDNLQPESSYGYPYVERSSRKKISIRLAITLYITIAIPLSFGVFVIGRYTAPQNTPVPDIKAQATPQITPTTNPTQVPPVVNPLNMQLVCQRCEEPNVIAFIKSYSTDALGYTSFTLLFTNNTSKAINMKVDTVKMIDQSGNSIPLHSSDPYVPDAAGQSTPTTVVFQLVPQSGSKYTLSIVVEEANVFANFYESTPLNLSQ